MNLEITETRDDELVWQISQSPDIRHRIVNDAWDELGDDVRRAHVKLICENLNNHVLLVTTSNGYVATKAADASYVCPQCGPDKNGGSIHQQTHHTWPPLTPDEAIFNAEREVLGCFVLDWKHGGTFEVHTMLLPECRGRDAIQAGREAIRFAFSLPDVSHLVSYCPENNRQSYLFAIMCGWHKTGVAATKWIKNGIAYAMNQVELDKSELKEELCR